MDPKEDIVANTAKVVADIEKRRELRKANTEKAKAAQHAIDLDALDALEAEHGDEQVQRLNVNGYKEGFPTFAVVKSPGGTALYKRYTDQVRRSGKRAEEIGKAQEMLGESCIVYPADEDARKAMMAAFPGMTISAGLAAAKLVELAAEDEKKG